MEIEGQRIRTFFEDATKLKIPSEINPPVKRIQIEHKKIHKESKLLCFLQTIYENSLNQIKLISVHFSLNYRGSGSTSRHNVESLKIEMSEYEKRLNSKTEKFGNEANREKIKKITDSAGISMSEIASCSYEARAVGVKNGMFMGSALRLCSDLQTIPYEFERFVLTILICVYLFYCHG